MSSNHKLTEEEIQAHLIYVPNWTYTHGKIKRNFEFSNFIEAFSFMTQVALWAERFDHHPDWSNAWNKVNIELTTHSAHGLTEKDFHFAKKIDSFNNQ